MPDASDAVTYHLSQRKAQDRLVSMFGGLIFVAAVFYFTGRYPANIFDQIGLLCIGLLVVWFVSDQYRKATSDRSPQLVLDREGLSAPRLFASKVPWHAIRGYEISVNRHEPTVLELDVVDPDRFEPVLGHPANWSKAIVAGTRFRLEIGELDGTDAEIVEALKRFAPTPAPD